MLYKRILAAIDGSPLSAHAANDAAELAQALGAELAFVYVVDISGEVSTVGGLPADDLVALGKQAAKQTLLAAAGRAKID
ncbi:MAG TPA: universal stress protein, partial [Dehalococcoidia bacterium]|nr:universal stress protein [Dehalococcoidia bacterium]